MDQLFATAKQEQRAEARYKMLIAIFTFVLGIFVIASICLMCWLFLYFKQPQFIEKVIIGFLSGIAGIGSGFSLSLFFRPPGKKECMIGSAITSPTPYPPPNNLSHELCSLDNARGHMSYYIQLLPVRRPRWAYR